MLSGSVNVGGQRDRFLMSLKPRPKQSTYNSLGPKESLPKRPNVRQHS